MDELSWYAGQHSAVYMCRRGRHCTLVPAVFQAHLRVHGCKPRAGGSGMRVLPELEGTPPGPAEALQDMRHVAVHVLKAPHKVILDEIQPAHVHLHAPMGPSALALPSPPHTPPGPHDLRPTPSWGCPAHTLGPPFPAFLLETPKKGSHGRIQGGAAFGAERRARRGTASGHPAPLAMRPEDLLLPGRACWLEGGCRLGGWMEAGRVLS